MAEFLTTSGTSYHIENIIKGAKSKLVLVTPYLKLTKTLFERLRDADKRGVKITLIFGKNELPTDQQGWLGELSRLEVFYFENLHAKCYFNEDTMVITSMNMYEFSEKNNREMGVLIARKADADLFQNAVVETKSIQESSQKMIIKWGRYVPSDDANSGAVHEPARHIQTYSSDDQGFCIRCGITKFFNPSEPYCRECYYVWADFGNRSYPERFCHLCGQEADSSMDKPLCRTCYQRTNSYWR